MNPVSSWLSTGYSRLAEFRVKAFDQGYLKKHKINVPVISVGNLTFGGTGKTPVTEFLMKLLIDQGQRPGIASRAYKARRQEVARVNPRYDLAKEVGDEALLLARRFPQSPVYSGKSKWQVAKTLSEKENVTVVLLDDGFQHLALIRDLDIVLLDAMEKPENYHCFPVGRAREPWQALDRSQLIFLTKCNLAEPATLNFHREKLKGREVFEFNYAIQDFENFKGEKTTSIPGQRVLLVSAIAKPSSFETLVKNFSPGLQFESMSFPDHHSFNFKDVEKIRERYRQGFNSILVTEKDFVKLKDLRTAKDLPIWQAPLKLTPNFSLSSLEAKLNHVFA